MPAGHLQEDEALHFRDQLRIARASALADAEGSHAIVVALEQLGARLCNSTKSGLAEYRGVLSELATSRADDSEFGALFDVVRRGRNVAVHSGAYARHLSARAVELAIAVEGGIMNRMSKIKHYMVRDPVKAESWHSLSHLRQLMLSNSFSYLPLFANVPDGSGPGTWWFISDRAVARALLGEVGRNASAITVATAWKSGNLAMEAAPLLHPDDVLDFALEKMGTTPGLVVEPGRVDALLGIATPFDLL